MQQYPVVGNSLKRVDAVHKVTGSVVYGTDMKLPGMLWGKVLRSNYPHARLLSIDTSKAKKLPGVKAVLTANDLPTGKWGLYIKDQSILAGDKVRYIGDAVALVAATDEDTVDEALGLIEVEYQQLPAVFNPEEAMKPNAPLIHEELGEYDHNPWYCFPVKDTNICNHFKLRRGDIQKGFRKAEFLFEQTFKSQMVHHCYIEPHAAVASVDLSGGVTVWTNTQSPYQVRSDLSDALQMYVSKIRVIATKVGGGFGGKIVAKIEPYAVVLSQKTRKPVKMVMGRSEEFTSSAVRHAVIAKLKTGVTKSGIITATEIKLLWDTGAYSEHGPAVCRSAGYAAGGPYKLPNIKTDSYCIYTNKVIAAAFRGFGASQTTWAIESQMDMIANDLGMDPLEIRINNAVEEGSVSAWGEVLHSVGVKECLEKAAGIAWGKKIVERNRGKGVACMHRFTRAFAPSCAFVKLNEDGSIGVLTSAVDIGQGSDTVLAQIAAEELGVLPEDIILATPDTHATPYDAGTMASRITFHMGNAIKRAAIDAKQQMLRIAAQMLEAEIKDLEVKSRRIYVKGTPEKGVSITELSAATHRSQGGPILGKGSFLADDLRPLDPQTGLSEKPSDYWHYGAQVAEVEVDAETGEAKVGKLVCAADVGYAINPLGVKGQIYGGAMMGLGGALLEEIVFHNGRIVNPTFMDYIVPTAVDAPQFEAIIVEKVHPDGPFGAKGVGEGGTPPVAPAIANAIFDAIGVRIQELPITSEKIFFAVQQERKCQ